MNIVLLGAPGSGKGTQAAMLKEKLNISHISTGDIFRANIREGTALGIEAKEYIDKGQLVPDRLTTGLVASRLKDKDCSNGFILDGFPRTISQGEMLEEEMKKNGKTIDYAIYIEVTDEKVIERISGRRVCKECNAPKHISYDNLSENSVCDKCGGQLVQRDDDKEETVKKRLETYYINTKPLIKFYDQKKCLIVVDGKGTPKEVYDEINNTL